MTFVTSHPAILPKLLEVDDIKHALNKLLGIVGTSVARIFPENPLKAAVVVDEVIVVNGTPPNCITSKEACFP